MKERVLVAMSGGVDSSVAAALLVQQGYDAVGVTMKLFCHGDDVPDRPCCSLDSVNDARRVCVSLGIPHYVLNMESAFSHDVVQDFVSEYARGRTPIPCVRCNTFTKFRDLVHKADEIDARWIATGHYARVIDGRLHRGLDHSKDQSYFLWVIAGASAGRLRRSTFTWSPSGTKQMSWLSILSATTCSPSRRAVSRVSALDCVPTGRIMRPSTARSIPHRKYDWSLE